jgi:peroxiredoxin
MKFASVIVALALIWPAAAAAFDIGPAVGSRTPALHATDMAGKAVSISSISGKKGVVLLFFRSAKWCPFCQAQLIDFRAAQAPLEAKGYRLAAISYDPPDVLQRFADKQHIQYQLLSDAGSTTIDAFKLRDPQYAPGSMAYGVPMPAIFVISPKGVVKAKLAKEGFKMRPSVQEVLAAVDSVGR